MTYYLLSVAATYNCEDFKDSDVIQNLRVYARSQEGDLDTETCVQGFQDGSLLLFWEDDAIADATPPTGEFCEANGVFEYPPGIHVKRNTPQQPSPFLPPSVFFNFDVIFQTLSTFQAAIVSHLASVCTQRNTRAVRHNKTCAPMT